MRRSTEKINFREGIKTYRDVSKELNELGKVAGAICAACVVAFGRERCDLERVSETQSVLDMNKYFMALNDWQDIGKHLPEDHPFAPRFKEALASHEERAMESSTYGTLELGTIRDAVVQIETLVDEMAEVEQEYMDFFAQVTKAKELVNAIEILANVDRIVTNLDFPTPQLDGDIDAIATSLDWMTSVEAPADLTPDQERLRMLYFATMSVQMSNDIARLEQDRAEDIWKPITVLTERFGQTTQVATAQVRAMQADYATLAEEYGLSKHLIQLANTGVEALLSAVNSGVKTVGKVSIYTRRSSGTQTPSSDAGLRQQYEAYLISNQT